MFDYSEYRQRQVLLLAAFDDAARFHCCQLAHLLQALVVIIMMAFDHLDEAVVSPLQLCVQRGAFHSVWNDDLLRIIGLQKVEQHAVLRIVFELT